MTDRPPHSPTRRRSRRLPSWQSFWFVLPLVTVWLLPIVILATTAPLASTTEASNVAPQTPVLVVVGARLAPPDHPVTIQLAFARPTVVSSRRNGIVTAIDVKVGDTLHQGIDLLKIDGHPVLAFVAAAPLFRDLHRGDTGEDVRHLSEYLVSLRLLATSERSADFDSRIEAGVQRLERTRLGVTPTGRFSLGYVAFVPRGASTVRSIGAQVGDDVLAGGPVVTVGGPPVSAVVLDSNDGKPLTVRPGALALTVGTSRLELSSLLVKPTQVAPLYRLITKGVSSGTMSVASPSAGQQGGAGDGAGGDTSAASTIETYNGAAVVEANTQGAGTVPATAVFTTQSGASCIFVRSRAGGVASYEARALSSVDAVPGQLGVVGVPPDLAGATVVRNPLSLRPHVLSRCTSR